MTANQQLYLGIDWGGSKIEIVAMNSAGEEFLRERRNTPKGDYRGSIATACDLVAMAERQFGGPLPLGVGIPGSISPVTGKVQNANSAWLNGRPLQSDLEQALSRAIPMENDANCLALSEALNGAAAGYRSVFAVILGTGCGAGVVLDGRLQSGPHRIAGEWGHNPLPLPQQADLPAPDCFCGRQACLETYISGTGIERQYRQAWGASLSAEEIIEAMREGQTDALETFHNFLDQLARGLAGVINLLDPEVVVIGGGLSNVAEIYKEMPDRIPGYMFCEHFLTHIVPAAHGDSSGVRGAARLTMS